MSRFARQRRVIYWEEPEAAPPECEPALGVRECAETGVIVVTPSLPETLTGAARRATLRDLLDGLLSGERGPFVLCYCTPRMLSFSRHLPAAAIVYDRLDDRAGSERDLLDCADLVFTRERRPGHANHHHLRSGFDAASWDRAYARMSALVGVAANAEARPPIPMRQRLAVSRPSVSTRPMPCGAVPLMA